MTPPEARGPQGAPGDARERVREPWTEDEERRVRAGARWLVKTPPADGHTWQWTNDNMLGALATIDALRAQRPQAGAPGGDGGTAMFASGVLAALAVVASHDAETIYREIVGTVGADTLLMACEDEEDREWSGLKKYGYRFRGPGGRYASSPTVPPPPERVESPSGQPARCTGCGRLVTAHDLLSDGETIVCPEPARPGAEG